MRAALEREIERDELRAYLRELDEKLGPVPPQLIEEARRAWKKKR